MSPSRRIPDLDLEPVHAALVSLCRRDAHLTPGAPPERGDVIRLAARHSVLGLALTRLSEFGALDEATTATLRTMERRCGLLSMRRERAVSRLRDAGITVMVLKGSAIAEVFYGRPAERDHNDIDVLVAEPDVASAVAVLENAGYTAVKPALDVWRRHHFHIPMDHTDGHTIELHWALSKRGSGFRLDPEAIRAHGSEHVGRDGSRFLTPRSEHLALHMVMENIQEGFARLSRSVDIDRIVYGSPGFDWGFLVDTAIAGGLRTATALSLGLAAALLGTEVPGDVRRRLAPPPASRVHLGALDPLRTLLQGGPKSNYAARILLDVWLADTWRTRIHEFTRPLAPDSPLKRKHRVGSWGRVSRFAKVVLLQTGRSLALPFRRGSQPVPWS